MSPIWVGNSDNESLISQSHHPFGPFVFCYGIPTERVRRSRARTSGTARPRPRQGPARRRSDGWETALDPARTPWRQEQGRVRSQTSPRGRRAAPGQRLGRAAGLDTSSSPKARSTSCDGPPVHFVKPSADVLFESAAEAFGPAPGLGRALWDRRRRRDRHPRRARTRRRQLRSGSGERGVQRHAGGGHCHWPGRSRPPALMLAQALAAVQNGRSHLTD